MARYLLCFTFLGRLITKDGRFIQEVTIRVVQSKAAFNNLKNILSNKNCPSDQDSESLHAMYVFWYACETWTMKIETACFKKDRETKTFENYR